MAFWFLFFTQLKRKSSFTSERVTENGFYKEFIFSDYMNTQNGRETDLSFPLSGLWAPDMVLRGAITHSV